MIIGRPDQKGSFAEGVLLDYRPPFASITKDMVALSGEMCRLYQESTGTIWANLTHGWLTKHSAV